MNLPLIPQDKANHAANGAAAAAVCASLVTVAGAPPWASALVGAALALALGLLKERLDMLANARATAAGQPPPHSVERGDVLATLAGGLLVALPLVVVGLLDWGV